MVLQKKKQSLRKTYFELNKNKTKKEHLFFVSFMKQIVFAVLSWIFEFIVVILSLFLFGIFLQMSSPESSSSFSHISEKKKF